MSSRLYVPGVDHGQGGLRMLYAGEAPEPPPELPAFTAAPVVDSFNRANEVPLSAPWTTTKDAQTTDRLGLFGNIAAAEGNSDCEQVYDVEFGPDVDVAVKIVAGKQNVGQVLAEVFVRVVIDAVFPDYVSVQVRRTAGVEDWDLITSIAGTIVSHDITAHAIAVNDKIGLRVVGTEMTAYHFSGGSWAEVSSATIVGPAAAGAISLRTEGNQTGFDDLQAVTL